MSTDRAGETVPLTTTTGPRGRFLELDGLRGIGAAMVVVYHLMLVLPSLSALYSIGPYPAVDAEFPSSQWWLFSTPLRSFWGGHEAVLIFFVLSGFVLTLPLLGGGETFRDWLAYYVRRIIRLYVPVWASLVFAMALASSVQRDITMGSSWLRVHPQPTGSDFLKDSVLLFGVSNLNSPLWSLRWEMWFSLLLPLFLPLLRLIRVERWWQIAIPVLAVISGLSAVPAIRQALPVGWMTGGMLEYMPIFAIGMVLCLVRTRFARPDSATADRSADSPVRAVLIAIAVLTAMTCTSFFGGTGESAALRVALDTITILAVCFVVVYALRSARFGTFLRTRPVQWMGQRSFSLYLVHEPIVVAGALLISVGSIGDWLVLVVVGVPLILILTELFYRGVEKPTHRLARGAGRRVSGPSRHTVNRPTA